MTSTTRTQVRSRDGVAIAVYETGDPSAPTIVAVHGYPDDHTVWDRVVPLLAEQHRVVTYDVRGAGASDKPEDVGSYRQEHLTDDLVAVLDAVSPGEPVHLLAHDWGSIQSWPSLADPRVRGRVRSFFSISGPSLDHASVWLRTIRQRPRDVLRQLGDSWYIYLFQLPALPELLVRRGILDRLLERITTRSTPGGLAGPPRTRDDARHGIQLYRANVLSRLGRVSPPQLDLPVQVLAPRHDPHVTAALQTQAPAPFVPDLRTEVVDGGHWIVWQQPDLVAERVLAFVRSVEAA
ncbi:MAG: alpha/beta fold hydrolase [Jatrophihabitans sp.]|uniref:alpha/beta fold hydrolase n=1 Tax=Jatrophihabitans sp. TaxID=1932789 RepID=UPI003F811ED8